MTKNQFKMNALKGIYHDGIIELIDVPDTQAIIKFLNGKKVINDTIDSILKMSDAGGNIIIIPSVITRLFSKASL